MWFFTDGQVLDNSSTVISGPCAQADGETDSTDPAVDVELAAGFFVPSAEIGVIPMADREAAVGELERQLAAVGMPGQAQVDAQLGGAVETVGVVGEEDVDRVRHHQTFDSSQVRIRRQRWTVATLEVHADQVERINPPLGRACVLDAGCKCVARQKVA